MKSICYFFILVLVLSIGCDHKMGDSAATLSLSDSVRYDLIVFGDKFPKESAENFAEINIEYCLPDSVQNPLLYKSFVENILIGMIFDNEDSNAKDATDFIKLFLNSYKEEIKVSGRDMSWDYNTYSNFVYNKNGLLCVQIGNYAYQGGAHPSKYNTYKVMDVKTGNLLTLGDFFEGDYKTEIEKTGEKYFRKEMKIPDSLSLVDAGYFEETFAEKSNNHFIINDNFFIDDSSIHFYYNDYEIACYAQGPSSVTIPFEALKGLKRKR
jgi:hypothetical protein